MHLSIRIDLENVIYISYRVPVPRIRHLIPDVLELNSDADNMTYLSLVAMKCRRVRLNVMPWPRFDYYQLNVRIYVKDPETGDPAVYFFRSGVSQCIIPLMTRLAGIPWEKISFKMVPESPCEFRASGEWSGKLGLEIVSPEGGLPENTLIEHLTGPLMGFMGSERSLRSFKISHRALQVLPAVLRKIDFPLPVKQEMIAANEIGRPDSVMMVPEAEFTVYLPPRRIIY